MGGCIDAKGMLGASMWDMGGYGQYVWPAFGLVMMAKVWLMIHCLKENMTVKKQIKQQINSER